jgi:hypothetical protein
MAEEATNVTNLGPRQGNSALSSAMDLLSVVQSGDVTAFAVAMLTSDGNIACWVNPTGETFKLLGAVAQLSYDICHGTDDCDA